MKRQVSISIFLAIFVIVLALLYIMLFHDSELEDSNQKNEQLVQENIENSITISQEYITYQFYIKDEDGWLVVFRTKTQERYMDTGIETDTLSMEMQEQLEAGIFFQTEVELIDFLESYSS